MEFETRMWVLSLILVITISLIGAAIISDQQYVELKNTIAELEASMELNFEDTKYVYLVDENTGVPLVDPNTGYRVRLHVGNNLQGLVTIAGVQQQSLQNHKDAIELNRQQIQELVSFLNQSSG